MTDSVTKGAHNFFFGTFIIIIIIPFLPFQVFAELPVNSTCCYRHSAAVILYGHLHIYYRELTYVNKFNFCFNEFAFFCVCTFRQTFGDEVLGALNLKMIEVARSVGAAAKFTGSGGAIVAFCPEGPDQVKRLEDACQNAGFITQQAIVVPSVLTEKDLKTLSS